MIDMTTTISYQNFYEESITGQQLGALNEYYKVYSINGIFKKKEFYSNGELKELEYIKDKSENINDIFTALGTNDLGITEFEQFGNYKIEIRKSFHNGIMLVTSKYLRLNERIICEQDFDSNSIPKLETTIKNLYDYLGEEFEFKYNADGSLDYIGGSGYPFSGYNQSLDAIEVPLYFPNLLTDNPYYANANFLP
jgi:hypothetical protein